MERLPQRTTGEIQKELIDWFESYTGRKWFSIDPNPPRIIEEVKGERQLVKFSVLDGYQSGNNITSFAKKEALSMRLKYPKIQFIPLVTTNTSMLNAFVDYYHWMEPVIPATVTFFNIEDLQILNNSNSEVLNLWHTTRRAIYAGEYFGKEKGALNALFIGNLDSVILAQRLTPVVNLTFFDIDEDYNLTRFNTFSAFDVIVLASDRNAMELVTTNARERIGDRVYGGGGLVAIFPWTEWAEEVIGLRYLGGEILPGSIDYINYSNPILGPFFNMTEYKFYWGGKRIIRLGKGVTSILNDTNGQPWISANLFGSGRGVFCGATSPTFSGMGDSYVTILTNAIFYASRKEKMLPVLWRNDSNNLNNDLEYSVTGRPGGPILLWLKNNGSTTTFDIHLNASFFQLSPEGWIVLDAVKWLPLARGGGRDIRIKCLLTNVSWLPIYIMNDTNDLYIIYSNADIEAVNIYPNQVIYSIKPSPSNIPWIIIKSLNSPYEVMFNNRTIWPYGMVFTDIRSPLLIEYSLAKINNASCLGGSFYDPKNKLLYVKLKVEEQNVRVVFMPSETILAFMDRYRYLLYATFIIATIVVELYLVSRKKSGVP